MNAGWDANIELVVSTQWKRAADIEKKQLEGYELIREEKVTTKKIAMVFRKLKEEGLQAPEDFVRRRPVRANTIPRPIFHYTHQAVIVEPPKEIPDDQVEELNDDKNVKLFESQFFNTDEDK